MNARRISVGLMVALAASASAVSSDHPAGQLPTHIVIARGEDPWSGRLRALQFLPTLGTLDAPAPPDLWEASRLLDAASPDFRQLWTFRHSDTTPRTPTALRWEALSPTQQAVINVADELGAMRIDYLRGVRQQEHNAPPLRQRTSTLGAMRGAHVRLLGPPDFVLDSRHREFRERHARRPWMVYVGANDGFLHAFDARTGTERFAVMPDAVLPIAARNTSTGQPVPGAVCRRPFAADAWTGAQWHSVLACANGAMGSGLFLVDVTDPTSSIPPPMLAYDASDNPTVGHIQDPIPIVPLADGGNGQPRWFAISGNGKGDAHVESRLLLLALDQSRTSSWQPNTAYSISVPATASRGGLGAPAVALGPQANATFAYAADSHGQIWRFDLRGSPPWRNALGRNEADRSTPFFVATSRSKSPQGVVGPILLAATANGPMLVFTAVDTNGAGSLYGVVDTNSSQRNLSRDSLGGLDATDVADGVVIRPPSGSTTNGWRIDLPAGQVPDDLTMAGTHNLLLTTRDAAGRDRAYLLDALTGLPADKNGRTGHVLIGAPLVTVLDAAPTQTPSGTTMQTTHTSLWQLDGGHIRQLDSRTYTRRLGRLSWREMTETGAR